MIIFRGYTFTARKWSVLDIGQILMCDQVIIEMKMVYFYLIYS